MSLRRQIVKIVDKVGTNSSPIRTWQHDDEALDLLRR
jgi:hypothetical protein